MRQTSGFISTYSADTFGVCSALYELGGMVVMHDASGCNSTYTTHDEPRWYDMDSMVYISALTEIEAIMGDDSKLIEDIVRAAEELHPRFIAIAGTPIPAMTGFDADAAARVIEERTGIPSFGFTTTGMKSYVHGAKQAFEMLADRIVEAGNNKNQSKKKLLHEECTDSRDTRQTNLENENVWSNRNLSVNILGLTPLDFSVNGSDKSIAEHYRKKGCSIISGWAMGSDIEEIKKSAEADLNIVVSETGIGAAQRLKEKFGIPFRVGIPVGGEDIDVTEEFEQSIKNTLPCAVYPIEKTNPESTEEIDKTEILILGERVNSFSLAKYISKKICKKCMGYATTDSDEDEIVEMISSLKNLKVVIADPLFKPMLKLVKTLSLENIRFIEYPHEAFSGRLYRAQIPNVIDDANLFL